MHSVSGWSGLMSIEIACDDAFFQRLPVDNVKNLLLFITLFFITSTELTWKFDGG